MDKLRNLILVEVIGNANGRADLLLVILVRTSTRPNISQKKSEPHKLSIWEFLWNVDLRILRLEVCEMFGRV